jgi:hypothetical protein
MLHVFHIDVAKVDQMLHMLQWLYMYVANVCSKCFIYFFRRKLHVRLSRCCICFTHMLQVFHLNIAHACNDFQVFFQVFCQYFRRMLHVFHLFRKYFTSVSLDATKVDWVPERSLRAVWPRGRRSGGASPTWAC